MLRMLPAIVHIRDVPGQNTLRGLIERMMAELRDPQPGGALIIEHLAQMILVQALRQHLTDTTTARVGWLFALADPQMSRALTGLHDDPARR